MPITISDAKVWIDRVHRHHRAPLGGLFAVACAEEGRIIGVAVVGRPVARRLQDGWTVEVTRVAVEEGHKNACSKLYGACWRAARALGWRKAITYTLQSERGTSVKAAGWTCIGEAGGGSWNVPSRPRIDNHPLESKMRWEIKADGPSVSWYNKEATP